MARKGEHHRVQLNLNCFSTRAGTGPVPLAILLMSSHHDVQKRRGHSPRTSAFESHLCERCFHSCGELGCVCLIEDSPRSPNMNGTCSCSERSVTHRCFAIQTVSIIEQRLTMTENKLRECLENQQKITLQVRPLT